MEPKKVYTLLFALESLILEFHKVISTSFIVFLFFTCAAILQVDLEHNHYRSFQGLTCLMQISTRTEDFVIDTLKLRVHIGPYLRPVFKDPTKRKVTFLIVMHNCDHVGFSKSVYLLG